MSHIINVTKFISGAASAALIFGAGAAVAETEEFDESWVRIEINAKDGDAGFQGMTDGEGWRQVKMFDPNGKQILHVKAKGSIRKQNLTEMFFESAEPPCEDQPIEEFLERFPESNDPYAFRGKGAMGLKLVGESELTHLIPYAPTTLAANTMGEGVAVVEPVQITWMPGVAPDPALGRPDLGDCNTEEAADAPDAPIGDLFGFQLVVEREHPEPLLVFSADLADGDPGPYAVDLPVQFTEENAFYKYEVVAIESRDEERGNQTIWESTFCTAEAQNGTSAQEVCDCIAAELDEDDGDPEGECFPVVP